MYLAWNTSKYHPKLPVNIYKFLPSSQGQGKVKLKISGLVVLKYILRPVFRQEREDDPRTLPELRKADKN